MKKWVCQVCGYVYEGENPPANCPQCKAPASKFSEQKEGEMNWAAEHVVGVAKGVDQEIIDGLRENFTGECTEVGMYLAMARVAHREGYPEIGLYWEKAAYEEMAKTEIDPKREILHVDITGEIYLVCDSFSNQNLAKELAKMGVETRKSLTVSGFLKDAIIPKIFRKGETHLQRAFRMAKPYLSRDIGGDALECVSDVAYANERGIDGIIHISPFTCMPEIMSQNIFPAMRENCDIPILPLIMDEQTGKAGYLTRLEAFVDLMRRRKRKNQLSKKQVEIVK